MPFEDENNRVGMFQFAPARGVERVNRGPGIQRFLSATGVPVTLTVYDRRAAMPPTAGAMGTAIGNAMMNGCAVVVGVQFDAGAHALTLAGTNVTGRRLSGLVVHNSQTESYEDVHPLALDSSTGHLMLLGVPRAASDSAPEDVPILELFVMCVGGVPSVRLAFAHNTIAMGSDVHARCFDEGHMSAPDMCACDHWHSGPRGTAIRGEARVMEMPENPCGHGCYSPTTPWADLEVRCCGIPPP